MASFTAASGDEDETEDDSDSSSNCDMPLDILPLNIEKELETFRQQWRQELHKHVPANNSSIQHSVSSTLCLDLQEEASIEDQAKYLFLQGVNAESSGRLNDAILYYRRAVQLVPDVEFRVDYKGLSYPKKRTVSEVSSENTDQSEDLENLDQLLVRFTKLRTSNTPLCFNETQYTSANISDLPIEVLNYIFKWVVTNDLDVFTLEALSEVCRGFYICARDEDIWRRICQRVWGYNCGSTNAYDSWRNMFIDRPHLKFHGCYISKMTYMRQGEHGLDNFYKPFHYVEYYRFVRFFPDGQMLMLTSPEDPQGVVGKLKQRKANVQGILYGYYKMAGDCVTGALKRKKFKDAYSSDYIHYRKKNRRGENQNVSPEQFFNVEFLVQKSNNIPHSKLTWFRYSVRTIYKNGQESVADFDLNNQSYPAMVFSRVKSYTRSSESPLQ